ncbi:MAG: decarboxylating 6-phosphogluconate dehydrogenase [Anaerolineales bacterium]|nr:decarboxylating 6-phosphogluconate dehydrogenase [Anaerolineales bacterium]MBS3753042.1 decarboxylating 6-phosphogluconate dehydrogenase [Anaerolineales bacterium]
MKLAMIGLGKMGGNMSRRLLRDGHQVIGYNRSPEVAERMAQEAGLEPAFSLREAVDKLPDRKVLWIMVPAGKPTETIVDKLTPLLGEGDILIDGGNSNYKETLRRGESLAEKGIYYIDVGTSGGVWGLKEGYSMMVGGEKEPVEHITPVLETLAPGKDKGWGHVGPPGSGHFVKMIHNGIEYGMMQAYAEGFEILKAKEEFELDLHQVSEIWRFGSVIRSWLLDLTARALEENPTMEGIDDWVNDSGEGRWTVFEAIDLDIPAPVITLALQSRLTSRMEESFAHKLLAAMRNQFGGHAVKEE